MSKESEISALFDDELDDREGAAVVRTVLASDAASATWHAYALIGDRLRSEPGIAADFAANVMARLREEPVVLAPKRIMARKPQHPLLALAASLAGVAVVGWLALGNDLRNTDTKLAYVAVAAAPTFARVEVPKPKSSPMPRAERSELGEYFVAHHAHAATPYLGEGAQHVRTVSMMGESGRP